MSTTKTMTQAESIAEHMRTLGPITALIALDLYGCFRLAARIHDLEAQGLEIIHSPYKTSGGATITQYALKDSNQPELF